MSVSNREYQLTNDLISLQVSYNAIVRENDILKQQLSAFASSSVEKEIEREREINRLKELLARVKSYEAPSTTLKRKKKDLNVLPR